MSAAGVVAGRPTAAGASNFTVKVVSGGREGRKALAVNVGVSPVTVTTAPLLPNGRQGVVYAPVTLSASGGNGDSFAWSVTAGSLPAGLTLSPAGAISGTPTAAGASTFTVQAASGGQAGSKVLTITVG